MPSRGTLGMRMSRIRVDGTLAQTRGYRSHYVAPDPAYSRAYDGAIYAVNNTAFVTVKTFSLPPGYVAGSDLCLEWYTIGNGADNSVTQVLVAGVLVAGPFSRDSSAYQEISALISANPGEAIDLQMRRNGAPGAPQVYLSAISVYAWDEAAIEMTKKPGAWF
jgi:hypothetical protein